MSRIDFAKAALQGRVLDVGHSVGPIHSEISVGRDVTAIDVVIKKCGGKVVKGDATRMPFKEEAFDSLLAGELIEHIKEPALFLKEGSRVLKEGGTLVITTPNRFSLLNRLFKSYQKPAHLSLFSREELLNSLEKEGFRAVKWAFFPYTEESSEGSTHKWFYPLRKAMNIGLPNSLREQMAVVARKEKP